MLLEAAMLVVEKQAERIGNLRVALRQAVDLLDGVGWHPEVTAARQQLRATLEREALS